MLRRKKSKNQLVMTKMRRRHLYDLATQQFRGNPLNLNNLKPSIKFTTENEKNGTLPFLNVQVKKPSCEVMTSVNRKPSHTGRYLKFILNQSLS